MNDLTRFVALPFESLQTYRVVDKDGNPWFVVKDICEILEIKQPARAVKDFPKEECTIVIIIHNGKK
jgi:prophage antirepressor-like protein